MNSDSGNEGGGEGGEQIKGKDGKGTLSKRKRDRYQRQGLIEVTLPAGSAAPHLHKAEQLHLAISNNANVLTN